MNRLTLLLYERQNGTARLKFINDRNLYRIDHLFDWLYVLDQLRSLLKRLGKGLYHKECLDLFDRKDNHWVLMCSCANNRANLALWFVSSGNKHLYPKFYWNGVVSVLTEAITRLLHRPV